MGRRRCGRTKRSRLSNRRDEQEREFLIIFGAGLLSALAIFFFVDFSDHNYENKVAINSLTISEFTASQTTITGKCDVAFDFDYISWRNRYYESSLVSVLLGNEVLWVTKTRGLFVENGKTASFTVNINTSTFPAPTSLPSMAMLQSRKLRLQLMSKVKYEGELRELYVGRNDSRYVMNVECEGIEMRFVGETTLKGGPVACHVEYNSATFTHPKELCSYIVE